MTKPAIQVEGLWKEYVVGSAQRRHSTFYDMLGHSLKAPFNRMRKLGGDIDEANRFWALSDVNFEVQAGEVVGVIGRNGAGKSTLLKILSRITAPTRGRIHVRGRLTSLLEVGTGFHPELSGRENIFLNGAILGMSRAEVTRKFDEIVAFSEVEKFIDTPVKRYSSGMYVRLAFSVAAHLQTDVLIVDEVLAVGDAVFQRRCLGRMGEVARDGRAVLFVSHNLAAVNELCSRAILLNGGEVLSDGPTAEVVNEFDKKNVEWIETRSGQKEQKKSLSITRVEVLSLDGNDLVNMQTNSGFRVRIHLGVYSENVGVELQIGIYEEQGHRLSMVSSAENFGSRSLARGGHVLDCNFKPSALAPGRYLLNVAVLEGQQLVDIIERCATLNVVARAEHGKAVGPMLFEFEWSQQDNPETSRLSNEPIVPVP